VVNNKGKIVNNEAEKGYTRREALGGGKVLLVVKFRGGKDGQIGEFLEKESTRSLPMGEGVD